MKFVYAAIGIFMVVVITLIVSRVMGGIETGRDIRGNCVKTELMYSAGANKWRHVYDCSKRVGHE